MKKIFFVLFFSNSLVYAQTNKSWIDEWQKSTVSIGIIDTLIRGKLKVPYFRVIGTGVIFYVKYDTILVPCLVTAKHVFYNPIENWNPSSIRIRFSWFDEKPVDKYLGVELLLKENKNKLWYSHPNNNVDLACLPFLIPDNVDVGKSLSTLAYKDISSNDAIYEGSQILVLGYPGNIGKEFHSKALVRFGIISWVPPLISYDNKILIDCNVYPGNSGGPVFKMPNGMQRDGSLKIGGSISFIGIVTEQGLELNDVLLKQKNLPPIPLQDSSGSKLLTLESIGIGVIEPASHVRELLAYVQKEINK